MGLKVKILMAFFAIMFLNSASSQTIKVGNKFFDGKCLYTCQEIRMGKIVYFTGVDYNGDWCEFTLKHKSKNEYTLHPSYQAEDAPFNVTFGCSVRYIRQDGMYFLEVLNKNEKLEWVMLLTPDDVDYCLSAYPSLVCDRVCAVSTCLLNRPYLSRFPKSELRIMRNMIYARHGHRFESEEMQALFSSMEWYKPNNCNKKIKLSIIEKTNLALIMAEEAMPDDLRKNQGQYMPEYSIEDFMFGTNY